MTEFEQSGANDAPNFGQDILPGDVPTESQVGTYQAQFESIRMLVCSELQKLGAEYAMSAQKLVRTCINANLQISSLAEQHCQNILQKFTCCRAKLVSHTNVNAMYVIDDRMLLVDFDLGKARNSVLAAKFMQPAMYDSQLAITSELLLLRQLQALFYEPIDDTSIVVPYKQCVNSVVSARKELERHKDVLRETILSRAYTAFNFEPGLSLYTLNFSDDMSMLFWDRYTITDSTMKSYYIEQHCIIEHTITGDVEPERFIAIHKPSKNNTAQFLASRLACLTSMVRPNATMDVVTTEVPVNTVDDDDELFTDEELIEMGYTEADIAEYHANHDGDSLHKPVGDIAPTHRVVDTATQTIIAEGSYIDCDAYIRQSSSATLLLLPIQQDDYTNNCINDTNS